MNQFNGDVSLEKPKNMKQKSKFGSLLTTQNSSSFGLDGDGGGGRISNIMMAVSSAIEKDVQKEEEEREKKMEEVKRKEQQQEINRKDLFSPSSNFNFMNEW